VGAGWSRHEEAAREQAQQGVSPDKPDCPQGVLPGCRRAVREGQQLIGQDRIEDIMSQGYENGRVQ